MQVIAHRANTRAALEEALALGCDYAEVDVYTVAGGQLIVTRDPVQSGALELAEILSLPIGLYLDVKQADAATLALALRGRPRTVVWGSNGYLAELLALDAHLGRDAAGAIGGTSGGSLALVDAARGGVCGVDFGPELVERALAAGAQIFVDRLGEHDTEEHWERARQLGATAIQTDRPADLLRWREMIA